MRIHHCTSPTAYIWELTRADNFYSSYYEDMMYARLARAQADAGNALMFVTDAAPPGVDLAMWCIRTCTSF